jgi:hypothetical protein
MGSAFHIRFVARPSAPLWSLPLGRSLTSVPRPPGLPNKISSPRVGDRGPEWGGEWGGGICMSLVPRGCLMAAAVGLAAPPLSAGAFASREARGPAGVESARQRLALRGPRIAQLGRSGGGSTATRPSGGGASGGIITSGPPPSPVSPSTSAPASQLGGPAPQAPAIAPLSPSTAVACHGWCDHFGQPGLVARQPE